MSVTGPIPPFPTDDGGIGSQDVDAVNSYSPGADLDDQLNWLASNSDKVAQTIGAIHDKTGVREKDVSTFVRVLGDIVLFLAKIEADLIEDWVELEAQVYSNAVQPLSQAAATEAEIAVDLLSSIMTGGSTNEVNFGPGALSTIAQTLFNLIVAPFSLTTISADPTQPNAGFNAQNYLLSKATTLTLQEWLVRQLGSHMGMGFFRTLSPFLEIIDRSVNPSNVVRQAMEAGYAILMKAPLTRDLNRLYPMKDLGVTALCKLYLRGAIDQATYLDRCLNAGLSNEWAQQLILETTTKLTRSDIAKLLQAGYITQTDARELLLQQGFDPAQVDAVLYLDTHSRYFSLQERVGSEAVTAWKHGYIDQTKLESILQQCGYSADEIALLEVEGQFTKSTTDQKDLTYTQVKDLFVANIIGIDDVITFLQDQGYSDTNVMNLVLLDFVKEADRTLTRDTLVARLRVEAAEAQEQAAAAAEKNQADIAAAKTDLAKQLTQEADLFGQLTAAPAIIPLP